MQNNSQRVAVSVKDSTAKLIMGLLVDVGLPFEYRKAPGQTMTAVVSVAERNGPTLLKVRGVIEDRQERAKASKWPGPDTAPRTGVQMFKETHKGFDLSEPKMPPGYTLEPYGQNGWRWAIAGWGLAPAQFGTKVGAASAAWTHHFEHTATAQ